MGQKIELNQIYNMDCLEGMASIPDKSIDCIIVDLPYAITANKWDLIIPMHDYITIGKKTFSYEEYMQYSYSHNIAYKEAVEHFNSNKKLGLWSHWKRIIKDDGVIALFGNEPFTSFLIRSNTEMYRYSWVWKKEGPTGFLNSKYRPLQITEDIAVFSKAKVGSLSKLPIIYHPPGLTEVNVKKQNNPNSTWRENKGYSKGGNVLNSNKEYTQSHTGWPNNILQFSRDKHAVHPTQKPVALIEYLIKTYTKEGETVLDSCMGSGTTAIACINTDRNYIGFELNKDYYNTSVERVGKHLAEIGGAKNE